VLAYIAIAAIALPSSPLPSLAETIDPSADAGLDPAARLLEESQATETWDLYVELESGHRIVQKFLLTNAGPGSHTAVAVGHLVEPGRTPYRYENGRRRARWTLSEDRLFFDIAASHIDLHRPRGELRISKQDVQIQLFFDFASSPSAGRIPRNQLPEGLSVDVLAVAAPTRGKVRGPWMDADVETTGHTWLVHSWSSRDEAKLIERRVEIFGRGPEGGLYGLHLRKERELDRGWQVTATRRGGMIESKINVPAHWADEAPTSRPDSSSKYPLPSGFRVTPPTPSGQITLKDGWLRFDPLDVIPQPFRWFIRMRTRPQQVWADASIDVTLFATPGAPSLQRAGEPESAESTDRAVAAVSASNSRREMLEGISDRNVTGVASITFMNPVDRR